MSNTIDIFTEIQAHTGAVVSSEITAQVHIEADVFAEITVPVKVENMMHAKFFLYGGGISDVLTEIGPRAIGERTIEAEFYTRALGTKDIRTEIETVYRGKSEVYAEIQPRGYVQIPAEIEVRPHTNMTAIYEVKKPPILSMSKFPTQDSFTKKEAAFQTINYGKSSTMVIGNKDEFESFVKFETNKLDSRYIITEITLEMHYLGEVIKDYNINLHTAERSWNETGITYRNKPPKLDLVSNEYKIDQSRKVVSFDITETASKWFSGEVENNGFVLSSINPEPLYFRTNNAGQTVSPRMIVKYYDSIIPSTGRSQVRSELFIAYRGNKDVFAEIEVDSTYSFQKVPVELYVHRYDTPVTNEVFTEITAHNPDVTAVVTAARRDKNEVLAAVYVRSEEQIRDKQAVISVTRDTVWSKVTARQLDTSSIAADIYVSRKQVLTEVTVSVEGMNDIYAVIEANDIHVSYLPTEITPRAIGNNDIFVEIEPNIKSDVPTEITAIYRGNKDVTTEIHPRVTGNNDILVEIDPIFKSVIESEVTASRPEILVEIKAMIRGESDIHTEITPRAVKDDCVDASISVNRKEIHSEIYSRAWNKSDLLTEIVVKQTKKEEVPAEIAVRRDVIYAEISPRVLMVSNIASEVTAQRRGATDQLTEIAVRRDEIYVELFVSAPERSNIPSEITAQVHKGSDKFAEIYVSNRSEVLTEIDVVGASMIASEITMSRQTIKTEIMVPYHGGNDVLTEIAPRIIYAADIHCQIIMGKVSKGYAFIL